MGVAPRSQFGALPTIPPPPAARASARTLLRSRAALFREVAATYQGYADYARARYPQRWNRQRRLSALERYTIYTHDP